MITICKKQKIEETNELRTIFEGVTSPTIEVAEVNLPKVESANTLIIIPCYYLLKVYSGTSL